MNKEKLNIEIFKDIKDYKGHYQISNFGRVKSIKNNKILKPRSSGVKKRYQFVCLCKNSICKEKYIHRLVAERFIGNPKKKYSVNHKDGNPKNNVVSNLEWATGTEQNNHAFLLGLKKSTDHSKLTEKEVLEIYKSRECIKDLSKRYKISGATISLIKNNKIWKNLLNKHKKIFLFCYGTLKKRFALNYLFADSGFVGEAILKGYDMYSLVFFPCITKGKGKVFGEVYNISKELLRKLDLVEIGYRREEVDVEINGKKMKSYVYIDNVDRKKFLYKMKKVNSGVWT